MKISPRSQISNHKSRRFEKKYYSNISVIFFHTKRIHNSQGQLVGRVYAPTSSHVSCQKVKFSKLFTTIDEKRNENNKILLFLKTGRPIGRNENKIFIGHAFASIDWFQEVVPVVRSIYRSPFDVFFQTIFECLWMLLWNEIGRYVEGKKIPSILSTVLGFRARSYAINTDICFCKPKLK